ncbi:unnamed protein product [Rhodiola kirilowii]
MASPLTLRLSDLQSRFVATPLDPLWVGRDFPLGLVLDFSEVQSPSLKDVSLSPCVRALDSSPRATVLCVGGPKLRKWYGAAELLPKDGSGSVDLIEEEEDSLDDDEIRDAVLVTDGDSELAALKKKTLAALKKKTLAARTQKPTSFFCPSSPALLSGLAHPPCPHHHVFAPLMSRQISSCRRRRWWGVFVASPWFDRWSDERVAQALLSGGGCSGWRMMGCWRCFGGCGGCWVMPNGKGVPDVGGVFPPSMEVFSSRRCAFAELFCLFQMGCRCGLSFISFECTGLSHCFVDMVILSLIVKRARVKALVKDKRAALEAFGTYVESMTKDASDGASLKKALRDVRSVISPSEGFLSNAGYLKGVKHLILLSQLSVYRSASGIQSLLTNNARKMSEQDESMLINSGIPYTIVRAGLLKNTPGGIEGFIFEEGCSSTGSISKEDAAFICVEALDAIPYLYISKTIICTVANGKESVSNWKELIAAMIDEAA